MGDRSQISNIITRVKALNEGSVTSTKTLSDLPTPAALVHFKKVVSNCDRMLVTTKKFGINLRAMTKTHKTIEGALLQLYGSEGIKTLTEEQLSRHAHIAVSTLGEAEFFAQHGFRNILFPYPPSNDKLARAFQLEKTLGVEMLFSMDNIEVFDNFVEYLRKHNITKKIPLYIDIDPKDHRTGVDPQSTAAIDLAKKITACSHVRFHGLYVHGGYSYHSKTTAEIKTVAEQERDTILNFCARLKAEGVEVPADLVVATGSTPTATCVPDSMKGVNEFHPGNYCLYDAHQVGIGACRSDDCATTILTRVLSKYVSPGPRLLIDAGAFALSKDRGATHIDGYNSYGVIVGHPNLVISSISQEVGVIVAKEGHTLNVADFPVGTMLQIIPNHSCMSCYCYEHLYVVDGDKVLDSWKTCPRH